MAAVKGWQAVAWISAATVLTGCAVLPDVSGLFEREQQVAVAEVRRTLACGSTVEDTQLTVFDSVAGFTQWRDARGVQFYGEAEMQPGRYLLIEMGRRRSQGYGLAVSRVAGWSDSQLRVRATFIEPPEGAPPEGEAVSPCSLVRLPVLEGLATVEVIDQAGRSRALVALPGVVS